MRRFIGKMAVAVMGIAFCACPVLTGQCKADPVGEAIEAALERKYGEAFTVLSVEEKHNTAESEGETTFYFAKVACKDDGSKQFRAVVDEKDGTGLVDNYESFLYEQEIAWKIEEAQGKAGVVIEGGEIRCGLRGKKAEDMEEYMQKAGVKCKLHVTAEAEDADALAGKIWAFVETLQKEHIRYDIAVEATGKEFAVSNINAGKGYTEADIRRIVGKTLELSDN